MPISVGIRSGLQAVCTRVHAMQWVTCTSALSEIPLPRRSDALLPLLQYGLDDTTLFTGAKLVI